MSRGSRQGQVNESTGRVETRVVKKAKHAEIGTPRSGRRGSGIWRSLAG